MGAASRSPRLGAAWLGALALAGSLGCTPGSPAASEAEVRLRGEIKTLEQRTAELEHRLAEQQAELERLQALLDEALEGR